MHLYQNRILYFIGKKHSTSKFLHLIVIDNLDPIKNIYYCDLKYINNE